MKIKVIEKSYEEVLALPKPKRILPKKPSILFRTLVRIVSQPDLWASRFSFTGKIDKKGGPYLILMNHSSFIDLKIAYKILYPMPFNIVSTHDAFIGKAGLMRNIGCMPTRKFITDLTLISDMRKALTKNKTSVLMYPEAGYSLDGKSTALPDNFGRLVKILNVPVIFIKADGAFTRDPLYNGLQLRKVPVSATVTTLVSREELKSLSVEKIDAKISNAFNFDNFLWQKENGIKVTESFRADGLERILYRCAHCETEGQMVGKGTKLTCSACGKSYTLTELGELVADDGKTEFSHIPTWFNWQREKVREDIVSGKYILDTPVDIYVVKDYKALYKIGKGSLTHDLQGFKLSGCDGKLNYTQPALSSYSLNVDYFWYEIGDIICIGDEQALYYCFPPKNVSVAKVRLATEEIYKLRKEKLTKN